MGVPVIRKAAEISAIMSSSKSRDEHSRKRSIGVIVQSQWLGTIIHNRHDPVVQVRHLLQTHLEHDPSWWCPFVHTSSRKHLSKHCKSADERLSTCKELTAEDLAIVDKTSNVRYRVCGLFQIRISSNVLIVPRNISSYSFRDEADK